MKAVILLIALPTVFVQFSAAQDRSSDNLSHATGQRSDIRVVVVDGRSGKTIRGATVSVHSSDSSIRDALTEGKTDDAGVYSTSARLPENIAVHVKGRFLCVGKNIGTSVQSVTKILDSGVSESNAYCNPQVRRPAKPGELVLFVRRETLKELFDW